MRIAVVAGLVGEIANWILFVSLLVIASSILLFTLNIPLFLAVLCMSLFILPKRWFKWEFPWRLCFFLLTGIFLEISLILLLSSLETSGYIYIIAVAVPMAMSLILLSNYKWRVSRFISAENILIATVLLAVLILLSILGSWKLKGGLFGFSTLLVMLLMLNYIPPALRRTELFNFLTKLGNFHTPNDFIEEIIKRANKKGEEAEFLRYRFNEFLDQIERGDMEHAYVTLATGILELLEIWKRKKKDKNKRIYVRDKYVDGWKDKIEHNDVRASIVHSTPRPSKPQKDLIEDLERKRLILRMFKCDPYVPIKDLLKETAKKYELIEEKRHTSILR